MVPFAPLEKSRSSPPSTYSPGKIAFGVNGGPFGFILQGSGEIFRICLQANESMRIDSGTRVPGLFGTDLSK